MNPNVNNRKPKGTRIIIGSANKTERQETALAQARKGRKETIVFESRALAASKPLPKNRAIDITPTNVAKVTKNVKKPIFKVKRDNPGHKTSHIK